MARKLLEDLELGMVLGKDVHDDRGRFLLPKGIELDDSHLRLLRQWKVNVLYIQSEQEEETRWQDVDPGDVDPEIHFINKQKLLEMFSLNDPADPLVSALFSYSLDRLNRLSLLKGFDQ